MELTKQRKLGGGDGVIQSFEEFLVLSCGYLQMAERKKTLEMCDPFQPPFFFLQSSRYSLMDFACMHTSPACTLPHNAHFLTMSINPQRRDLFLELRPCQQSPHFRALLIPQRVHCRASCSGLADRFRTPGPPGRGQGERCCAAH